MERDGDMDAVRTIEISRSNQEKVQPTPPFADGVGCFYSGVDLASYHDLLRLGVEGDLLPGLDGGDVHAERHGVTVASFDTGVRRLA